MAALLVTRALPVPRKLGELVDHLREVEVTHHEDAVLPLADLAMGDDGTIRVPGRGDHLLNDWSRSQLATVLGLTPCVSKSRTAPVWAYYRYSRRAVICWECVLKRNVDRRRAFGVEIALALLAKTHISGHPLLHQAIAHSLLDEVKALRAAFPHPSPVHQARQQLPPAEDEDDMDVFACGYQEDQPVNPDDAALDDEIEERLRTHCASSVSILLFSRYYT